MSRLKLKREVRMRTMRSKISAVFAAGAGLALAFSGVASAGTESKPGPDQPGHPENGSLTIHKYEGPQGEAGDGTEWTPTGNYHTPLGGVEFTLWQLGVDEDGTCEAIDLSDVAAWENVPTGTAPADLDGVKDAGFCIVDPNTGKTKTTGNDGTLTFDVLDLGLYYVQETNSEGAYKMVDAEQVPVSVVSEAAPFYVTIPMPTVKGEGGDATYEWNYNVQVYPKNQILDAPTKTINPDENQPEHGLVVGDEVEYTITQDIPALNKDEKYTEVKIWDNLGSDMKFGKEVSVKLNEDVMDSSLYTLEENGTLATWTLNTEDGVVKAEIKAGDTIEIVFTATVVSIPESGEIDNPGSTDPNKPGYGSEVNGTKIPGKTDPYHYWGQLIVNKHDNSTPTKPLAGAEFSVTLPDANDACPADFKDAGTTVATGTSDAQGVVQWLDVSPTSPLGLWIANSSDGELDNPSKNYCVYETKAPAGYEGATKGELVNIKPGTTNITEIDVENVQKTGPPLPPTGAVVSAALMGIFAVGLGGLFLFSKRNREKTLSN